MGHSTSCAIGSQLVMYGGWGTGGNQSHKNNPISGCHTLIVLEIASMEWRVPDISGLKQLPHTYNHGSCGTDDAIVMFGGFDGRQATSGTYVLHVST